MQAHRVSSKLTSFQKQNLLLEFASLRHARLDGVYASIASDDPTLWLGVIFVRKDVKQSSDAAPLPPDHLSLFPPLVDSHEICNPAFKPLGVLQIHTAYTLFLGDPIGPYAPAVLRFQISFPPTYPALPPLVTFSTDIFHPFLTPLTTYTYSTGGLTDTDTHSATDEERLPPGGFSLRHGFPHWFARSSRSQASSRQTSGQQQQQVGGALATGASPSRGSDADTSDTGGTREDRPYVSVAEILKYIQSTFTDEAVLDDISLATAANPGAYHAWRTYRGKDARRDVASPTPSEGRAGENISPNRTRRPGEWNWEGVWEDRVKKGIQASLSDSVLFAGGTDEIHFLAMDKDQLDRIKGDMQISATT